MAGLAIIRKQTLSLQNKLKFRIVSLTIKIYKIMTQKNVMSARALGMEELEMVNGGMFGPKPVYVQMQKLINNKNKKK